MERQQGCDTAGDGDTARSADGFRAGRHASAGRGYTGTGSGYACAAAGGVAGSTGGDRDGGEGGCRDEGGSHNEGRFRAQQGND